MRDEFFGLTPVTDEKAAQKPQWVSRILVLTLAAGSLAYLTLSKGILFTAVLVVGGLLWMSGILAGLLGVTLFSKKRSQKIIQLFVIALAATAPLSWALMLMGFPKIVWLALGVAGGMTLVSALAQVVRHCFPLRK